MKIHGLIAEKIEHDPGAVRQALVTLKRWEKLGEIPPHRAVEWRNILKDAMRDGNGRKNLLAILRSGSEKNRRLQDFSPFAGMLTREERRKVFLKCVYNH